MVNKYIRFQWAGFVLWDAMAPLSHAQVARTLDLAGDGVLSAGFVEWRDGQPQCNGESTSLGLKPTAADSALLAAQLGLRPAAAPQQGPAA